MRRSLALFMIAGLMACVVPTSTVTAASGNAAARRQLNTVLPELNFSGVAFADALDFLRDVSGVNLTINWKALEEAGITRDTPVTLRLRSISMKKAMQMVLSEAGGADKLTYDIDDGVVEITTRELADQHMYTKVYPIEDLLMEIPDFTDAPQFDLTALSNQGSTGGSSGGVGGAGGGSTGGGGSGSGGIFGNSSTTGGGGQNGNGQTLGKTKQERAQDIMDLIRALIQPEVWSESGGKAAIRYFNGSLIITAPRSVQEAIGGPLD